MRSLGWVAATAVLVLGAVAVAVPQTTLASWQDDEASGGQFTSGVFQSQSQTAGSAEWASHPVGSPAELHVGELTGLAPGGTAEAPTAGASQYYWLNLRTAPGSHWAGGVALSGNSATGDLADVLEYRMMPRTASTEPCTAADMAPAADYWQPVTESLSGNLGLTAPADARGAIGICLEVRLAASAAGAAGSGYQGASAAVTWNFTLTQS